MRFPRLASLLSLVSTVAAQDRDRAWIRMDYGPLISTTAHGFDDANVAYKGKLIDLGDGAWVLFDTELLRVAAAWVDGGIELRGTPFDGSHGPIPRPEGRAIAETEPWPGWAHGRRIERARPQRYGSLPRETGRFRGNYLHGDEVVLEYAIGDARVLESFARVEAEGAVGIARVLEVDRVGADGATVLLGSDDGGVLADGVGVLSHLWPVPRVVTIDRAPTWDGHGIGAPSAADYADEAAGHGVRARWVDGFGAPHPGAAPPQALLDGVVANDGDDRQNCVFSDGERARLVIDLASAIDVQRINTYSWHESSRAPQRFTVYGSAGDAPEFDAKKPAAAGWELITAVDTRPLGRGGRHGSSIGHPDLTPLGRFRHLLFDVERAPGGTYFTEIDVFERGQPCEPSIREIGTRFAIAEAPDGVRMRLDERYPPTLLLDLPPSAEPVRVAVVMSAADDLRGLVRAARGLGPLADKTRGGAPLWRERLVTKGTLGTGDGPWVVDTISVPDENPWHARLRFGAFDFTGPDTAVLSTWNGDVWEVSGIDEDLDELTWRRIASGLHEPLGLKTLDGVIHVLGRDGVTRLHDVDGDGEIDWHEVFNHDVLVTRNFHEFAFDLQTDADGNLYFAKGGPVKPGGRGFDEITPHHGTVLRLSPDGARLEVFATGLRAPNGLAVSPDGVVTTGDNQGTWMPACRLNWLPEPGMFTSCVDTSHREPRPTAYGDPLCWFPMDVDNSGGGQVWVTSDRWGPLAGELLHLSYGTCNLYLVLRQQAADGRVQGGVAKLPVTFASSLMRGRFHEADGQLYVCGFKGWQTRAARATAFQRVRWVGGEVRMPCGMRVVRGGIELDFAVPLDAELAADPESFSVEIWDYEWSKAYGSSEYRPSDPSVEVKEGVANRDALVVTGAELRGARGVFVAVEGLVRCMQIRIAYDLETAGGEALIGDVYGTVNFLP